MVETKTGQDIWREIEAYELEHHVLSNLRKQKWVRLEDLKGWLSPEQFKHKIKSFFKYALDPELIAKYGNTEAERRAILVYLKELEDVFGGEQ